MKVKILKNPVGLYNLSYDPGDVVDLPDAQALELIETKHAEKTDEAGADPNEEEWHTVTDKDGKAFRFQKSVSQVKKETGARR